MKTALLNYWEITRTSYWFVPSAMLLLAFFLACATLFVDKYHSEWVQPFSHADADGAQIILSVIASSVITVAGVTFSITMVALTLTTSQFGPRLLRFFMQDRGTQVVLGAFLSTFGFCLAVLMIASNSDERWFVPHLSVMVGFALAILDVMIFVYFIHHVATSIQADNVIDNVAHELNTQITLFFPERQSQDGNSWASLSDLQANFSHQRIYTSQKAGFLQRLNWPQLRHVAIQKQGLICLHVQTGDYVGWGDPTMTVYSQQPLHHKSRQALQQCLLLGAHRTAEEDVMFPAIQLVEVAIRSLSPGINDPFTAITCVQHLSSALARILQRTTPSNVICDDQGTPRIARLPLLFQQIINKIYDPLRQQASPVVLLALMESLQRIIRQSSALEQPCLRAQADSLLYQSQIAVHNKHDRYLIHQAHQQVIKMLSETQTDVEKLTYQTA